MLQLQTIRETLETVTIGLEKRGIANAREVIDQLIHLDDKRKESQAALDEVLHDLNKSSREIGQLMKQGKK